MPAYVTLDDYIPRLILALVFVGSVYPPTKAATLFARTSIGRRFRVIVSAGQTGDGPNVVVVLSAHLILGKRNSEAIQTVS